MTTEQIPADEEAPAQRGGTPASREISWYSTFLFAERYASDHDVALDNLPIAGTPAWCGMPDDDARKLLALVLGGVREALNHDAAQAQLIDASHEVAAAAKWIYDHDRFITNRGDAYIPRKGVA